MNNMRFIKHKNKMKNSRLITFAGKKTTKKNLGSSETTREAPLTHKQDENNNFDFTEYIQNYAPSQIKDHDLRFLEWFVGFTEGDGSFFWRNVLDKRSNLAGIRIGFEITQKDPKILFKIKKKLGFGKVKPDHHKREDGRIDTYWVYEASTFENLVRILTLFNGNLVLPKRRVQYENWIKAFKAKNWLPIHFENKHLYIYNINKISTQNAWISGFIDAEGCFYAGAADSAKTPNVLVKLSQKLHITQKNEFEDNFVLDQISKCFESPTVAKPFSVKRGSGREDEYYRVEIGSLKSHQNIVNYLQTFKLKTMKLISFYIWAKVVLIREKKEHLNRENFPKLVKLCKSINQHTR
jgi:hypothetical protein